MSVAIYVRICGSRRNMGIYGNLVSTKQKRFCGSKFSAEKFCDLETSYVEEDYLRKNLRDKIVCGNQNLM